MDIILLLASIIVCEFAGIIGSIFTAKSIPTWYKGLKKPSFNPPNWLFAPAWTTLYLLMGILLFLVLQEGLGNPQVQISLVVFAVQLVLNVSWSIIFFGRRSLKGGLATILVLWLAIFFSIISFLQVSVLAALLLVPYILWTSFATVLNYSVLKLNPDRK